MIEQFCCVHLYDSLVFEPRCNHKLPYFAWTCPLNQLISHRRCYSVAKLLLNFYIYISKKKRGILEGVYSSVRRLIYGPYNSRKFDAQSRDR